MSDTRPRTQRGRWLASRRRMLVVAVPVAVAAVVASACTSGHGNTAPQSPVARTSGEVSVPVTPTTSSAAPEPDAVISTSPTAGKPVNPVTPITVAVASGRLTSVELVNPEGKRVKGELATDAASWRSTEALGYGKTYTLSAVAVNAAGKTTKQSLKYTTVSPTNLTMPYLNTVGGGSLENGGTYGIGIVPVVHFDEPIADKAAAEKALTVTTTPAVDGRWTWVDDQNAHFRPKDYWRSGTRVTITAKVYGVRVGPGLYGQSDAAVSFKIGAKHVLQADDNTHMVKVWFNDKLVRTMPTSMGKHLTIQGSYGSISLYTMDGTYTVIGHENPATMSSASFGLPASSPYGYAPEKVYWATKISTDGIYLHSAPWSVWAQGHSDQSHGCLNLSPDDATWFYNHSQLGDVVKVVNNGGPKITIWQGGDWSVPWAKWVAGSALH